MSTVMILNIAVALVNAVLALVVGSVYLRNHREIRSPFTLALLLFSLFFVVHNSVLAYHLITMMATFTAAGESFVLAEGLLQSAALVFLAWATLR